ncbi:MAG: hypothetical protein U0031_14560 [Thermomicrobiales bacterium]
MAHIGDRSRSGSGGREIAIAAALSVAITLVVAAAVGLLSSLSGGTAPGTGVITGAPPTPTPRTVQIAHEPQPQIENLDHQPSRTDDSRTVDQSSQSQVAPSPETASVTGLTLLDAPDTISFTSLAEGDWIASDDGLQFDSDTAVAARWHTLGTFDQSNIEIEAEIRVDRTLSAFCNQSFGVVVEDIGAARATGGGVVFPCQGEQVVVRLSDVTNWQNGYNTEPVLAEEPFDPGAGFQTYRISVSADRITLTVGDVVVAGTRPSDLPDTASGNLGVGLWSQGTSVTVKRIRITSGPNA